MENKEKRNDMSYVKLQEIINEIDINRGDVVLISSDLKHIIFQAYEQEGKADIDGLIDSIQRKIGTEGTLLFPTFNWDFCKGVTFDYQKTACKTGALSKAALKRTDFKRTKHPLYSFAVWGKDQELLCEMENESSFGADSPFAYLHKKGAKNLIIDVSYQHCFTFVHYVEEQTKGVDYRYLKKFMAGYKDETGIESMRTYSMFVRDLDLDVFNTIEPMDSVFLEFGAVKKYSINDIPYKLVDLGKAFPLIQKDILENKSRRLCTYKGQ